MRRAQREVRRLPAPPARRSRSSSSRSSSLRARSGSSLTEDVGVWDGVPSGRSTRSPPIGSHPSPETVAGADRQGRADRAGRRYALLRPGDGDGGLRLRPPRRPARRAPRPARPSTPSATTTSSAASAASAARSPATCARPGARYVVIDAQPGEPRAAPPASACASSRASRPTTRSCAPPGSMRARAVIACVDSDAENIFITLTARELRPDIAIVARAASEDVRAQAAARRRDARDLALQDERLGDGAPRAATRRSRAWSTSRPSTGWRRSRSRAGCDGRGPADRRRPRRCDHRRRCAPPTARSIPSRPAETVLARRRRRDGDGHAAHAGAPRGAVRARPRTGPRS